MLTGLGCGADACDDELEVSLAGQNVRSFLISPLDACDDELEVSLAGQNVRSFLISPLMFIPS